MLKGYLINCRLAPTSYNEDLEEQSKHNNETDACTIKPEECLEESDCNSCSCIDKTKSNYVSFPIDQDGKIIMPLELFENNVKIEPAYYATWGDSLMAAKNEKTVQHLMPAERDLLSVLAYEYDAAMLIFNVFTEKWCVIGRNTNNTIAVLESHMLTLNRKEIHIIDKLLCGNDGKE